MLMSKRMRNRRICALGSLLASALVLSACAATNIGDQLPTAVGGLPQGAPARPQTQPEYPAVHDMPPARNSTVLSGAEQKKLEEDLAAARARAGTGSKPNP
jgi:hypothetical protein